MKQRILFAVLVLLIGQCMSAPQGENEEAPDAEPPQPKSDVDEAPAAYNYNWEINDEESKNYYGQEETANDAGRVEGRYYVWLADGRLMTVSYYVDGDSGFVPTITFSDPNFNPPPADAPPQPA